jgi:hypothetical protein
MGLWLHQRCGGAHRWTRLEPVQRGDRRGWVGTRSLHGEQPDDCRLRRHETKGPEVLPGYSRGRLGGNQNFINQTSTLTIGPAEGALLIVVGKQDDAPIIDLHLEAR